MSLLFLYSEFLENTFYSVINFLDLRLVQPCIWKAVFLELPTNAKPKCF